MMGHSFTFRTFLRNYHTRTYAFKAAAKLLIWYTEQLNSTGVYVLARLISATA